MLKSDCSILIIPKMDGASLHVMSTFSNFCFKFVLKQKNKNSWSCTWWIIVPNKSCTWPIKKLVRIDCFGLLREILIMPNETFLGPKSGFLNFSQNFFLLTNIQKWLKATVLDCKGKFSFCRNGKMHPSRAQNQHLSQNLFVRIFWNYT